MNAQEAITLISNLVYKPGWTFYAWEAANSPGEIIVDVEYVTWNSNQEFAPHYTQPVIGSMSFRLFVGGYTSDVQLYKAFLIGVLQPIEEHETREFLRVTPSYWAPFHPHKDDGIARWENVQV